MELAFDGPVIWWRGPAPWYFVVVPDAECDAIEAVAAQVTYGWGVIPASVRIGSTTFTTSLFPKDGGYLVPVKASVRSAEDVNEGDTVAIMLQLDG